MIFKVVETPTSEDTNTSSKLSKTSSSTFDFPAIALVNFEKNEVFVCSKPLSNVSFFSEENNLLKKLILTIYFSLSKYKIKKLLSIESSLVISFIITNYFFCKN